MNHKVLVVGAGGAVGEAAARALLAAGSDVVAAMRRPRADAKARLTAAGAQVIHLDLADHGAAQHITESYGALMFCVNLTLLSPWIEQLKSARGRLLAFSSNNVAIDPHSPVYGALRAAETNLRAARPDAILVRPTLIYGDPRLTALPQLAAFARRWRVAPVPGSGRARVQPVFHGDLGRLAAGLLVADADGKTFVAGGPDILSMQALTADVVRASGARARVMNVPLWALQLGAATLGRGFPLDKAQIARAERDRLVVAADPIPPALEPRTHLADGLRRLFQPVPNR